MTLSELAAPKSLDDGEFLPGGLLTVRETDFSPRFQPLDGVLQGGSFGQSSAENGQSSPDLAALEDAAYARGFEAGIKSAQEMDDGQRNIDALTAAIERLTVADPAALTQLFWETQLALFRQTACDIQLDEEQLKARCEAAVKLVDRQRGQPILHLAPADAGLLEKQNITVPIEVDDQLLPGSVCLSHRGGVLIGGTAAIEAEIEARITAGSDSP